MVASIMPNTVFMVSSIYGTEYMGGYSLDMVASIMPHTKSFHGFIYLWDRVHGWILPACF
jgi:beta-glucanase (GH16 family)